MTVQTTLTAHADPTTYADAGDAVHAAALAYLDREPSTRGQILGIWVAAMIPGDPTEAYYRIVTAHVDPFADPIPLADRSAVVAAAFAAWRDRKESRGFRVGRTWRLRG